MTEGDREGRLLFVCTANICRSPTAELVARSRFGESNFVYRSAGFLAPDHPCPMELLQALNERGIDGTAHRSYQLDEASLLAADLVLTMESSHVQKATMLHAESFPKIMPLREAVTVLDTQSGSVTVAQLLAAANVSRDPRHYLGTRWDVDDPYGRRLRAYRSAVGEIEDLVQRLLNRLTPG